MKKIILCLFLLCSFGPFAKAQVTFSFDSIWVPPYICQAAEFDVEVFGMVADGSTQYGSQRFLVQNDTVWVNFEFVQGTGPATPYPLYRKITVPAPWTFGHYKIVAQGTYNGQVLQTITSGISICSGVSGLPDHKKPDISVKIYPNPTSGLVTITLPESETESTISLSLIHGNKMLTKKIQPNQSIITLNMNHLASGTYLLQYRSGSAVFNRKLVKISAGSQCR